MIAFDADPAQKLDAIIAAAISPSASSMFTPSKMATAAFTVTSSITSSRNVGSMSSDRP
jgi:hypothetical protein